MYELIWRLELGLHGSFLCSRLVFRVPSSQRKAGTAVAGTSGGLRDGSQIDFRPSKTVMNSVDFSALLPLVNQRDQDKSIASLRH